MSQAKSCPECGAPILDDAPKGFCPACLVRLGAGWEPMQNALIITDLLTHPTRLEKIAENGRIGLDN